MHPLSARSPLLGVVLILGACQSSGQGVNCDSGSFPGEDGVSYPSAGIEFAGIAAATWDGADGLSAAFDAATGAEPPLVYTLTVKDSAGAVFTTDASSSPIALSGFADGLYTLRVTVRDEAGRTAGWDRVLTQLVGTNRVVYRSEVGLDGGARALSGDGDLVALGGGPDQAGLAAIIDASDVDNPVALCTIDGFGQVTDIEIHENLLFVATDTTLDPEATVAVWIYDVSDPEDPLLVSTIGPADDNAHTISWGGGDQKVLLLASTENNRVAFYSFADAARPLLLGSWAPPPPSGVHDQIVFQDRLYSAYTSGFGVVDVADYANPVTLVTRTADWEAPFVHNLGLTDDGLIMAMSEEIVGGGLHVWDMTTLDAPVERSLYVTEPTHSIHNVAVRGAIAFCAWYVDGLIALDLADPSNPTVVGTYDTYAGPDDVEERADGAWPNVSGATNVWVEGPHIAVSDQQRGLILFDYFAPTVSE